MLRTLSILFTCAALVGCSAESLPIATNISGNMIPPPRSGVASMYRGLMVSVPGGAVNASGGNLHITRSDMSVGTRVHEWGVGAVWNSAAGAWQWNFDMSLVAPRPGQPPIFIDATGYAAFLKGVEFGEEIPGTRWFYHDADTIRSAGGLMYHFDASGWLASVNWASQPYPAIHFQRSVVGGLSRVTRIDQCVVAGSCTALYTIDLDARGRVDTVTDLAGRQSSYQYEGTSERPSVVRDPLELAKGWPGTRYEYDVHGRLASSTNSHDERIEYVYFGSSARTAAVAQIGEGDPVWRFDYSGMKADRIHASTTITSPLGTPSRFVFDYGLRIKSFTNADGEKWHWSWSDTDLKGVTDPAGVYRGISWSQNRTVLSQTHATGNTVVTTFAPFPAENRSNPFDRPILQITDDLGLIEARMYSPAGKLESTSNGEGESWTYAFAGNGDLTATNPAGVVTVYTDRGDHGGYATVARGTEVVAQTHDLIGNLLAVDGLLEEDVSLHALSIGKGGMVGRTYDANRNVASILLDDSGRATVSALQVEWRADGQQSKITRPYGGDTEFRYDDLGRLVEERTRVDGSWVSTNLEFDLEGRVTAQLRPNGMATRWTYRDSGDVASIRHERDWSDPQEFDAEVQFEYLDARRVAIRDQVHGMVPEQFVYDGGGRVSEIRYPDGEKVDHAYDMRNRRVLSTYSRADSTQLVALAYEHDLANRTTAIERDGAETLGVVFLDGRVDSFSLGNGVDVSRSYDPVTGAFSGFVATNAATQPVAQMNVGVTLCSVQLPAGRCVTEQTDTYHGLASTSYSAYQTDELGSERLLADSVGMTNPIDGSYDYDELSNLEQSPAGSFLYNTERNRLLEISNAGGTVVDYTYDDAGFVTDRNGQAISWSGMGRVSALGSTSSMQWDGLGRRVSITESGGTTRAKYGGVVTEAVTGTAQKMDLGWVILDLDTGSNDYRLFDFRGNAKLVLDETGAVTAHQHYAGYGRVALDGMDPTDMGFAGGTHMGDLVALGARIYDPIAARFLSQDPIPQIVNQYTYTTGNPVRFWDPGGLNEVVTGRTVTTTEPSTVFQAEGEAALLGFGIRFSASVVIHGNQESIHYAPAPPASTLQGGNSNDATAAATKSKLVSGSSAPVGESAAFGSESGGNGSAGKGRDGPNRARQRKQERMTSSPSHDVPNFQPVCGIGFEIVPVLLSLIAVRRRRGDRHSASGSRA
ncbi:MAG: RHS repeat-associated core domain-containing protein [Myxococcota bacterium]|jgi:RHS repeat-associated protein|nr:RHS repeat-associated core domain-containing protein [Myxococcota bacterium]